MVQKNNTPTAQKVMVIGCCGAGKSTYSKKLNAITQLELIHLDQCYWKPNWEEPNKEDWRHIVQTLANKPSWIIDGNYGGTMDIRIEQADTIIYLDYPTWKCIWRVISRTLKYWRKARPDMPEGCKERFDLNFLHYVATFNLKRRKKLIEKLNSLRQGKTILVFCNERQANEFLLKLTGNHALRTCKN